MSEKKELLNKIKKWIEDFKKVAPDDMNVNDDTFEGSAYFLLLEMRDLLEEDEL